MKVTFQILALIGLAFACAVIVFIVNAPKWLDGAPAPTTQAAR